MNDPINHKIANPKSLQASIQAKKHRDASIESMSHTLLTAIEKCARFRFIAGSDVGPLLPEIFESRVEGSELALQKLVRSCLDAFIRHGVVIVPLNAPRRFLYHFILGLARKPLQSLLATHHHVHVVCQLTLNHAWPVALRVPFIPCMPCKWRV